MTKQKLPASIEPFAMAVQGKGLEVDQDWLETAMELRPETKAGQSGKISITTNRHEAGEVLPVVSFRNAVFMGQQPTNIRLTTPMVYRKLQQSDHGTWMTDSHQEVYQCREPIENLPAGSRLLVGGLGLGVYSELALRMAEPERVVTVERNSDIIKLVSPFVRDGRHKVKRADIYKFSAAVQPDEFDVAMLDTWQANGEYCWGHEVVPLRRMLRPKVEQVWCWAEAEMRGQIELSAYRKICQQQHEMASSDPHMQVLRKAAEQEGLIDPTMGLESITGWKRGDGQGMFDMEKLLEVEAEHRQRPEIVALVTALLDDVGSPAWEARFGTLWDWAIQHEKAEQRRMAAKYPRKSKARKAKVSA